MEEAGEAGDLVTGLGIQVDRVFLASRDVPGEFTPACAKIENRRLFGDIFREEILTQHLPHAVAILGAIAKAALVFVLQNRGLVCHPAAPDQSSRASDARRASLRPSRMLSEMERSSG